MNHKKTLYLKISYILLLLFLLSSSNTVFAQNKHLGFQLGTNYFRKTERIGFKVYNNNQNTEGKYCFDNDGFSYQLGIIYYLNECFSVMIKYRTPRKCSYHYPATLTPFVYGPNTYWTKTEASSWIAASCFHFKKLLFSKPFAGLGIDYYKIKAYNRTGHIHPETGKILYIFPDSNYDYLGKNNSIGFLLMIGTSVSLSEKVILDFGGNYSFTKIKNWCREYDRANNQNMSGFYLNMNLMLLIW